jgi:hypothetical protein
VLVLPFPLRPLGQEPETPSILRWAARDHGHPKGGGRSGVAAAPLYRIKRKSTSKEEEAVLRANLPLRCIARCIARVSRPDIVVSRPVRVAK